jgi:hypothetical protein
MAILEFEGDDGVIEKKLQQLGGVLSPFRVLLRRRRPSDPTRRAFRGTIFVFCAFEKSQQ